MRDTPGWITALCDADYRTVCESKPGHVWHPLTLEDAAERYEKEKATAPTVTH